MENWFTVRLIGTVVSCTSIKYYQWSPKQHHAQKEPEGKQGIIETRKGSKHCKFQIFNIHTRVHFHLPQIPSGCNQIPLQQPSFQKETIPAREVLITQQILRSKIDKVKWDRILTHITKRQITDCYTLCCSRGTNFINKVYHGVMTWETIQNPISKLH